MIIRFFLSLLLLTVCIAGFCKSLAAAKTEELQLAKGKQLQWFLLTLVNFHNQKPTLFSEGFCLAPFKFTSLFTSRKLFIIRANSFIS